MKFFKIIALNFSMLITLSACTGWDTGLEGFITAKFPVSIKTDNKVITIPAGEFAMNLQFENGVYGITDPSIVLNSNNVDYKISIPKKAFDTKAGKVLASAKDIQQSFDIAGAKSTVTLATRSQEGSQGCTYCGYCAASVTRSDEKGNITVSQEYTNSCNCSGSQDVIFEIAVREDQFTLDFLEGKKAIAKFIGKSKKYEEKRVMKEISSCI